MYTELATVKGTIDLTPHNALDRIRSFLTRQGYTGVKRTDYSLTAVRRPPGDEVEQNIPHLMVTAFPQPCGGVLIKVRGNDQEEVQGHQAVWTEWSEGLPRMPEARSDEAGTLRMQVQESSNIPLVQPPVTLQMADTRTAQPRYDDSAGAWVQRGMSLAFGAFVVLAFVVLALGIMFSIAYGTVEVGDFVSRVYGLPPVR